MDDSLRGGAYRVMNNSGEQSALGQDPNSRPDTLERLLSHCAALSPQKTALNDPPNRNRLEGRSDPAPLRSYTFQSLDDTVTRLATRFLSLGLHPGDYVALQMPNFVDTPILVLALMRAKLVPCLIPLSWSIEDISRSFDRLKPKALVSCGRIEDINYSENMRELAFSHMHVRFVLGVGYDIADGVTDFTSLFDPQLEHDASETLPAASHQDLNDLTLVTYIDPVTPVPHNNGQILATGLLHVLELKLSSDDHILSAYPLSSIPGLAAHFYPWLLSGCALSLHHPFQIGVLQDQLQTNAFSYFAAPEQVIDWLLNCEFSAPQKLAIVRRDSHLPMKELEQSATQELFELWNLGGLGSVPAKYLGGESSGLFPQGRICLPSTTGAKLCLAGAKICQDHLYIKGRIFPNPNAIRTSLEWFSLSKRFDDDWLDTELAAFPGSDHSILLGGCAPEDLQKVAS